MTIWDWIRGYEADARERGDDRLERPHQDVDGVHGRAAEHPRVKVALAGAW